MNKYHHYYHKHIHSGLELKSGNGQLKSESHVGAYTTAIVSFLSMYVFLDSVGSPCIHGHYMYLQEWPQLGQTLYGPKLIVSHTILILY